MTAFLDNLDYRQPNKFRFSLIINFVEVLELPNAPRNWENNLINWARSDTYYGMVRSFSVPMDFVLDGADTLREQFYNFGLGAQVQLLIEKFNGTTYQYDTLYIGDIDFANIKDTGSINGYVLTVNVVQGGITKFVKAYEGVKYSIPLDDPNAVDVQITPISLDETCQYQIQSTLGDTVEDFFPGVNVVTNQQFSAVSAVQQVNQLATPPVDFSKQGNYFFFAQETGILSCTTGFISGQTNIGGLPIYHYRIRIMKQDNSVFYTIMDEIRSGGANDFLKNIQFSLPVNAGDKLFLWCDVTPGHNDGDGFLIGDGEMLFKYKVQTAATIHKGLRAGYVFENLMKQMNGNITVPCQSYLLNDAASQWRNLVITCGDAIRPVQTVDVAAGDALTPGQKYQVAFGTVRYAAATYTTGQIFIANASFKTFATTDDGYCQTNNSSPAIVTSWTDFFAAMNAVLNIGWGTEIINGIETSVLEAKNYFFQPTIKAVSVGTVASITNTVYQNYIYNSVKYGYDDQTYDQINGNTEFNSTAYVQLPVKLQSGKEFNLVSPYRGDSLGIEGLRINISASGSGSSNTDSNNDVFMIYINDTPVAGQTYYNPYVYTSYSGVNTNLYNMEISPARNLKRHGDYLHGILDKYDGEKIQFTSALKNYNLVTTDVNGITVSESADVEISSLPTKLFLPYQAEIQIKEPVNMLELVDKYPTCFIEFEVDETVYGGFIMDCSTDTDQNKPQKIKLLYTANNVMSNYIK